MAKKDIEYLMTIITDSKGLEILKKTLERTLRRNKLSRNRIIKKRKINKMYARSKKEIMKHENALAKKGGR